MSLYIEMEQIGDVALLQCAGRIVRAEALRILEDAVTSLSQRRVIVLHLSQVKMLDCGGLGTLVFLHNWTCANGIRLKLVNPSEPVRKMIDLTRLTCVLHVSPVDAAVEIPCSADRTIENLDRAVA